MTHKYKKKGGMPNYVFNPTLYSSSYGRIAGVGCPQQSSNILAANAQFGGSSVYCPATNPLATPITGPAAGPAAVVACEPFNGKRSLQMGGTTGYQAGESIKPVVLDKCDDNMCEGFSVGGSRRRSKRGAGTTGYQPKGCGTLVSCNKTSMSAGGARSRRRKQKGGTTYYSPTFGAANGAVDYNGGRRRRRRSKRGAGTTGYQPIGTSPSGNFGGSRRRRRRRRGGVTRYPSAPGKKGGRGGGRRGTKSKTHRGKNYETRKSSKRYRSGKFKKYLRGRKTMRAPDFPFAGGALQAPPSLSNIPYAPGYSTGAQLTPNLSALANPVPYKAYNHCQSN